MANNVNLTRHRTLIDDLCWATADGLDSVAVTSTNCNKCYPEIFTAGIGLVPGPLTKVVDKVGAFSRLKVADNENTAKGTWPSTRST